MVRWLQDRDASRAASDRLTRAVLDHLGSIPDPNLSAALVDNFNDDGPCWALPPGEWMITRYHWTKHRTIPVGVFNDKAAAEVELERLKQIKTDRPQHYALVRR